MIFEIQQYEKDQTLFDLRSKQSTENPQSTLENKDL